MAPPTPPASAPVPNPGSSERKKKKKASKVTPVQVAFLVERYLADNGFDTALAAFRSDAAHLFKPHHHNKPDPKGLLSLADILHDYITLKESRVAVDSAMQAMHSLVSTYYATHPPPPAMVLPLPPGQPSSPPLVPPLFVAPSTSSPPAQGATGYASPALQHYAAHTFTSVGVHNPSDMSTPAPTSLPTKKRKATKSAAKSTSASKKPCTAQATTSLTSRGKGAAAASQLSIDNPGQKNMCFAAAQPSSGEHSVMAKPPIQPSSVAKSLFRPPQPQVDSSPCTPQQSYPIEEQPVAYQAEGPSSVVANAHAQAYRDMASSQHCSIVSSSKTLIVSPLKGGSSYYAVERSYHVSSPLKPSISRSSKREHVKGKLNFDTTDARPGSDEQICHQNASTSSSDGGTQDGFDIDFTNLDIFDGDFSFSELLLDFDLDTEGVHCQNPSTGPEFQRLEEPVTNSGCITADTILPDSAKPIATGPIEEDTNAQGATAVTSVRAITKRIQIVSPVKGRTASYSSR